jgi:hypothetical protein
VIEFRSNKLVQVGVSSPFHLRKEVDAVLKTFYFKILYDGQRPGTEI